MIKQIKSLLKDFTGHEHVELTSRGNTAIFAAMYCARKQNPGKAVLYPDQGGWLTYPKYPKMLELTPVELKTNLGVIDIKELQSAIDMHAPCCLIYQNPAGYYAEQPMKEIYNTCKGKCLVILDASGAIGSDMCDGRYADMIVGSFGKWKVAEAGYGGFVSFKDLSCYQEEIFNTTEFDDSHAKDILTALSSATERITGFVAEAAKIKAGLSKMNIAHADKKGLNVIIFYDNEKDKQQILDYCETHKYEWTQCPRYIRIMRDAISIEVKRGKR